MNRLLREPLVAFLLLGALLFSGQWLLGGRLLASVGGEPFVVDQKLAGWIAASEARALGRAPSTDEVQAAVTRYARLEALRREARRLGLDEGDPIVERRLEQKMEFLLEGAPAMPREDELATWLSVHADAYEKRPVIGLEHRYFSGENAVTRALTEEVGDPFLGGPRARGTSKQLDARFGPGFGAAVSAVGGDGWSDPIRSSYGLHRVRITERIPGGAPSLDEVRERVRRDLLAERAASERARRLDELVEAMQVVMEADLESAAAQAAP